MSSSKVQYIERAMTDEEYARLNKGFDESTLESNNPIETDARFGFVAVDENGQYIGSASGLAYKAYGTYNPYFYLSDLYVEKPYRRQGVGATLLQKLEAKIASLGIKHIWTWTAGYEGADFYKSQGYTVFTEMEHWYPSGQSRFGFRKQVVSSV